MAKRVVNSDEEHVQQEGPSKRSRKMKADAEAIDYEADRPDDDGFVDNENGDVSGGPDKALEAQTEREIRQEIEEASERKRGEIGAVAEMGVVTKLQLYNFMNHDSFTINLEPQVNFLTGHNGSGKSAILTALTVALGAKANSTGRGTGIKSFIKTGKESCQVTVHLKNEGVEAYRPDVYGNRIVVERTITQTGGGGYKISGLLQKKTISTKREELDAILDHMNIQIDNPINVLSQDAARAFLVQSNHKDKYQFFLRGTQLAQLSQEYDLVQNNIQVIANSLAQKKEVIPEMKQRVMDAKQKVDLLEEAAEYEKVLHKLESEQAWRHVANKEDELATKEHELASQSRKLEKLNDKIAQLRIEGVALEVEIREMEENHRRGEVDVAPAAQRADELKQQGKRLRAQIRASEGDVNEIKSAIQEANAIVGQRQKEVDDAIAKLTVDNAPEKERRTQEISALEDLIAKIGLQLPLTDEKIKAAQEERKRMSDVTEGLTRRIQQAQGTVGLARKRVGELQAASGDPLGPYGRNMRWLLEQIARQKWRGQKPFGPLGLEVKLRDRKWQVLVEAQLGSLMSAFAVTHGADVVPLKRLFEVYKKQGGFTGGKEPQIMVYTPDATKDFSSGDVARRLGCQSLLSVLEFTNPDVQGIFIDRASIERTAVEHDGRAAAELAKKLGDNGTCVSLAPFNKYFTRQGTFSQQGFSKWNGLPLFSTDNGPAIREQEEIVKVAQLEVAQLQAEGQTYSQKAKELNNTITKFNGDITRLQRALAANQAKIQDLYEEGREEAPPDVAAMQELLTEYIAQRDSLVAQLPDAEIDRDERYREQQALQQEIDQVMHILADRSAEADAFNNKLIEACTKRTKIIHDIDSYEGRVPDLTTELDNIQAHYDAVSQEVQQWTQQVLEQHPERPSQPRSLDAIEKVAKKLKQKIAVCSREQGISAVDATINYDRAVTALDKARQDIAEMKSLMLCLEKALNLRSQRWHTFRRYIAIRAKIQFQSHMLVRGFDGKLIFDHIHETLKLKVITDNLDARPTQTQKKNPNQLSGGEKSFSTVALLLSFWDAVGCPIRCLDEFDVFMDAVVRKQTLHLMMAVAQASDATQYILISPQDTAALKPSRAVKVHKMPDPKRREAGQTRIDDMLQ